MTTPASGDTAPPPDQGTPIPAEQPAWGALATAALLYLLIWSGVYLAPLAHTLLDVSGGSKAGWTITAVSLRLVVMAATLAAAIWLLYRATSRAVSRSAAAAWLLLFAAMWLGMVLEEGRFWRRWHSPVAFEFYSATVTLLLGLAASFLGLLIARACKDRNLAAAVAVVGAIVDLWGVTIGSTHEIVTHHPVLHQAVSAHLPHGAGDPLVGALLGAEALVGPGDFVFIAIMLALVQKFNLRPRACSWLMWALLFVSLIGVVFLNWSVPAIVPMAVAVLLPNWRSFQFKREERFALAYAGGGLIVLALIWWALHRGTR